MLDTIDAVSITNRASSAVTVVALYSSNVEVLFDELSQVQEIGHGRLP
jgi:hypothetical protein